MEFKNLVIQESQAELNSTKRVIDALKDEHADWKPHQKSMSLGALASHIVQLQTWFDLALKKDILDLMTDRKNLEYNNFEGLGNILIQGGNAAIELARITDDDFWNREFTFKAGDHIIMKAPKHVVYRTMIMNHLIHHRGQLGVYLRLLNIPVPGVYGPSADER
ncbi:MAG: DinB family protein [Chitinophagales bacterium]|nr:DinB family protein [Chitinophagales bacterium]